MKIKHIGISILLITLAILYYFINPSDVDFLPKCPLYVTTGIYCPGCGSQRATHQLLNFNILGVIQQNVLFLFAMILIGYHSIVVGLNHFFNKKIYNYIYHPKLPIAILLFILVFWILRNIPKYPFNLLAPH